MLEDFKKFLLQTNALALAVGVIIGGAVGKVVSSLVEDLLMPVIGMAIPGGTWRDIQIALQTGADGKVTNALKVGSFAGHIVDFVIVAFVIFMITKSLLKPAPAVPAPATKDCGQCGETILAGAKKCKFCASAV